MSQLSVGTYDEFRFGGDVYRHYLRTTTYTLLAIPTHYTHSPQRTHYSLLTTHHSPLSTLHFHFSLGV